MGLAEDGCEQLLRFLRDQGNVLPIVVKEGETASLRKSYDRLNARGDGVGRPLLTLTFQPGRAAHAAKLLGTSMVPSRDGPVYVLYVETASVLPDGRSVFLYAGVRTGLYNVQPERGHACRLPDGGLVLAPTEEGLRRKLAAMARVSKAA